MADPVIHYTFDTDGTNSGSLDSANDLLNTSSLTFDTTNKLIGTSSVSIQTQTLYATECPQFNFNTGTNGLHTMSWWMRFSPITNLRYLFSIVPQTETSPYSHFNGSMLRTIANGQAAGYNTNESIKLNWNEMFNNASLGGKDFDPPQNFSSTGYCDLEWHHFVLVSNDSGTTNNYVLYIDNVLIEDAMPHTRPNNQDRRMFLGGCAWRNNGSSWDNSHITGNVDEFRFYDYAFTATQVNTLYQDTLQVVEDQKKLLLHYTFDTDGTNSGSLGSSQDLTIPSQFSIDTSNQLIGAGGLKAIRSDNNTLTTDANSQTNIDNIPIHGNGYTISLWAKIPAYVGDMQTLFDFKLTGQDKNIIFFRSATTVAYFGPTGGTPPSVTMTINPFDNNYHHHLFVVNSNGDGTSNASYYIDNTLILSYSSSVYAGILNNVNSIYDLHIGASQWPNNPNINGYIDDFRLYDYGLTVAEINTLYISGKHYLYIAPIIHYTFDTDGTNSGSYPSLDITTIPSDITFDSSNKLIGDKCISIFSDAPSPLTSTDGSAASNRTIVPTWTTPNNFTISLWTKLETYFGTGHALMTMEINGSVFLLAWWTNSTTLLIYHGANLTISIPDVIDNEYHHFLFTITPTEVTGYVDNVSCGSVSCTTLTNQLVTKTYIGASSGSSWCLSGYIDDFRVYDYAADTTMIDMIYKLGSNSNVASLSGAPMSSLQNAGATLAQMITTGVTVTELLTVYTITQLVAAGVTVTQFVAVGVTAVQLAGHFTQIEIDIAFTQIKIHSDFTISDGTSSSAFTTADAVYTPTTFADKLSADLVGNTVTVGGDYTLTDSTKFNRLYLQFANAATLTGVPTYIFTTPVSDFSVSAGGQVNLRNVNLDAEMTMVTTYEVSGLTQLGVIINGTNANDQFGYATALSEDGTIMAVGSPHFKVATDPLINTGMVQVYIRTNNIWAQIGEDIVGAVYNHSSGTNASGEYFGTSVSLSADGTILAVGSPHHHDTGAAAVVAVRVYKNINNIWTQLGGDIDENMGSAGETISLSADGNTLALSIPNQGYWVGRVKIYTYVNSTTWTQRGQDMNGVTDWLQFSRNMVLSADGNTVAIGAFDHSIGTHYGRVEIRKYVSSTNTWTLVGGNIYGNKEKAFFGNYSGIQNLSISLSTDGTIVAIVANGHPQSQVVGYTQVYEYKIPSTTEWSAGNVSKEGDATQTPDKYYWTQVGQDIDATGDINISGDGIIVMLGANMYKYVNNAWTLVISIPDTNSLTVSARALSSDGTTVVSGNRTYNSNKGFIRTDRLPGPVSNTSTLPANNYFINNFVSTIETDLVNFPLSYDEPNKRITFDGLTQDISMSITSTDTTIFDTSITEITTTANTLSFITYGQPDPTPVNYNANGMTFTELLTGYTTAQLVAGGITVAQLVAAGVTVTQLLAGGVTITQLLAGGVSQLEIDIATTQIKIHSDFTISDGSSSSAFTTADAVYTLTTFADKLSADLGNPVTVGGDYTLTDSTKFNRLYLQFANAATLIGVPKYIFNIPVSDFSVGAGGQVNLRNVNLDAEMTMVASYSTHVPFGQLGTDIDGENAGDQFGQCVSISANGTIVAIAGGRHDNSNSGGYNGHVQVYQYKIPTGTEWASGNVIKGTDTTQVADKSYWTQLGQDIDLAGAKSNSGIATVELSPDGTTVAVCSRHWSQYNGRVRVFERDISNTNLAPIGWTQVGGQWVGNSYGYIGTALSLSTDNTTLMIGSSAVDFPSSNIGQVEVYERNISNTNVQPIGWTQVGAAATGDNAGERYGISGKISSNGRIFAAGAPLYTSYTGMMRVFERYDTKTVAVTDEAQPDFGPVGWNRVGETIIGKALDDSFGQAVSLSADGTIVAGGGTTIDPWADGTGMGPGKGYVQVYKYKIPTTTEWTNVNVIKGTDTTQVADKLYWTQLGLDIEGEAISDRFGFSLSLNADGTIVAIGAIAHNTKKGYVRVYQYANTTWTLLQHINGEALSDRFGGSVSLNANGTNVVIGAQYNDGGNAATDDRGHAQIYKLPKTTSFSNTSILPANNYFINNFVNTIETDLVDYTLLYDASNALITFDGLTQDISMSITSTDTTIFDTSITEITTAANTLSFITYGQPDPTPVNYNANGMTVTELLTGYTIAQLVAGGITVAQLLTADITITQLLTANISITVLIAGGITVAQLFASGVSIAEIFAAGVVPDWKMDTDANHFVQSYVKDFIDISGSLLLRENANLTVTGNIETKGNIIVKNPTLEADLSLNHNMLVGGDISMNGNVTVGDISMNGKVVDCSFTDASIPESAFNGTIPGPDYTQPTIIYEKDFDTTADVSMNANVQINNLKVDGNVEFSDGTTMNTYDDNLDYTNIDIKYSILNQPVTNIPYDLSTGIPNTAINDYSFGASKISSDGSIVVFQMGSDSHGTMGASPYNHAGLGLLISRDSGATWNLTKMPDASDGHVTANNSHHGVNMSRDGKHISCITGRHMNKPDNHQYVWFSHDYGVTWTQGSISPANHTSRILQQSCISDDGVHIYVNSYEEYKMHQSHDSGSTWTSVSSSGRSTYYGKLICSSDGKKIAFSTGSGNIYMGSNYGTSFQSIGLGSNSAGIIANADFTKMIVLTSSYNRLWQGDGDLTDTNNWTDHNPFDSTNTYRPQIGLVASPNYKYIILHTEGHNSKRTVSDDYGATWSTVDLPDPGKTCKYNMSISDTGKLFYFDSANTHINMINLPNFKASTFTSLTINNTLTAGSFSTSSDYRIKTDISQLDETVTIDNLRPVKYLQTLLNKPQYGLIAHELQEYYPDLVVGEKDGEEWQRVNYTGLVAILINEIKQLKQEITELENEVQ